MEVHQLYDAVANSDLPTIRRLIQNDHSIWTKSFESRCICGCREHPRPLNRLFRGRKSEIESDLALINQIFDEGLLLPEEIPDWKILDLAEGLCGWEHNTRILQLVISKIPISRLTMMNEPDRQEQRLNFPMAIMQHPSYEQENFFIGLILDNPELHPSLFHKYYGADTFYQAVAGGNLDLVRRLSSFKFDPNDSDTIPMTSCHRLLRNFKYSKDPEEWEKVRIIFSIINNMGPRGLDLDIENELGNSIKTLIMHYGWEPFLGTYDAPPIKHRTRRVWSIQSKQERQTFTQEFQPRISAEALQWLRETVELTRSLKYAKMINLPTIIIPDGFNFGGEIHNGYHQMYGFLST